VALQAMPVGQVGETPARLLLGPAPLLSPRHAFAQSCRQLERTRFAFADFLAGLAGEICRAPDLDAVSFLPATQILEPVAERPRRKAIVPVVGLDDPGLVTVRADC